MADDRLRDLERRASAGDAEARAAYLRELIRIGDARIAEVRELEDTLRDRLASIREMVDEWIWGGSERDKKARRCPELQLEHVLATVRMAMSGRHGSEFGYGYKTLARVWPR